MTVQFGQITNSINMFGIQGFRIRNKKVKLKYKLEITKRGKQRNGRIGSMTD